MKCYHFSDSNEIKRIKFGFRTMQIQMLALPVILGGLFNFFELHHSSNVEGDEHNNTYVAEVLLFSGVRYGKSL